MEDIQLNKSNNEILVSICCITYNHAPYIRQCLDGFLMQKTNFKFEVLIHDDASTDGTEEIIRAYESKYPEIIKPIYEDENQWNLGRRGSAVFNFPRAKGKYIALCEGDDYWTDPLKLQKQVDFLEVNPDFSGSSHACRIVYVEENRSKVVKWKGSSEIDLADDLIKDIFMTTGSLIFRREVIDNYPEWTNKLFAGDFVLKYLILCEGKIKFLNEPMSVYRKGVKDSWSKLKLTQKRIDTEYSDIVYTLRKINKLSNYNYSKEIAIKQKKSFRRYLARSIIVSSGKNKLNLFVSNICLFRILEYKIILKYYFDKYISKITD